MPEKPSPRDFSRDVKRLQSSSRPAPRDFAGSTKSISSNVLNVGDVDPDISAAEKVVGGLVRGLRKDPISRTLFDKLTESFPEAAEEDINRLVARTQNSTLADVFSLVGEFGPSFALGAGAFSAGRNLAIKGVAKIGARQGLETAAGRVAARQLTQTERVAKFGRKKAKSLVEQPVLERGAQIAGGGAGIGAFIGAEELIDGAPVGDAAKAALFGAALSGAFEGALFGLGKVPVLGLRTAKDPTKIDELFEKKILPMFADDVKKLRTTADRIALQIRQIVGLEGQEINLRRALEGLPALTRRELGRPVLKKAQIEQLQRKQARLAKVKSEIKAIENLRKDVLGDYLRGEPYNPKGFFEVLAQVRLNLFQTPESFSGQLGRTMTRFIELVGEAENRSKVASNLNDVALRKMVQGLGAAMGFSHKQMRDGRNFGRVFNAWEKFGEVGVRNFMANEGRGKHADEAVKLFEVYDRALLQAYNQLVKLGAEPRLKPGDLRKLGLSKFIPHILDDIPEQAAVDRMAAAMGPMRAQEVFNLQNREGLSKFGSIDFQRRLKGSLLEKILPKDQGGIYGGAVKPKLNKKTGKWETRLKGAHNKTEVQSFATEAEAKAFANSIAGLPFNANPIDATFQYLNAVHRRIEYGQRFGFRGEIKDKILSAARAEGASSSISHSLIDLALGHRYYPAAMQQFSRSVTGLETGSKLGLAVLPNLSQSINTVVFGGLRNFTRGLILASKGENRSEILQSVAMMESIVEGLGRTFGRTSLKGSPGVGTGFFAASNILDAFAHGTLRYTGFSSVEKWNRMLAASTGYHVLRDTLAKNAAGRLKGQTLDVARRRLQTMGVDLEDATRVLGRFGPESAEFKQIAQTAMFRSSTATQFNPNILRKPLLWNHPYGRIMAQFKTFALGQGRFIRDQVFKEAQQGNLKPLAYFLSIYPIAGEAIAESKAIVRLKKREPFTTTGDDDIDRIIQDFTMVGGLGILTDMFTSARFGQPLESVMGPAVSDAADLVANLAQGRPDKQLTQVLKTPTAQAIKFIAVAGGGTAAFSVENLQRYLEAVDEDSTNPDRSIIDLGQLRQQKKAAGE